MHAASVSYFIIYPLSTFLINICPIIFYHFSKQNLYKATSSPLRSHTAPESSLLINSRNVTPPSNVTCVRRFFITGAVTNIYPTLKI